MPSIGLILAQAPPPPAQAATTGPDAATIFYVTILLIFVTAIVTTIATKWSRDKALKFFHGYHVTLERSRGQTSWGKLRVFPTGLELVFDHPYVDVRGIKKTSFLMYGQELDQQLLSVLRYHDELDETAQKHRRAQIQRTFNPGPLRRTMRGLRNLVNTLRDAFNAAVGAIVGQYQRLNPLAAPVLSQPGAGQNVTQLGQTLIGRVAANAYEPLLEQYIGRPVILDVADPLDPNNAMVQYAGYLADYTQQFMALFNVEHTTDHEVQITLPDVDHGDRMAPLPAPPPPGAAPPALPAPLTESHGLKVRIDGVRFRIQNTRAEPVVVRRLERSGFEPLAFGMVIPSNGMLDLPARDARGGKLILEILRCVDVVAPRKWATIRHAGEILDRRGLVEEFHLNQLPLVPKLLGTTRSNGSSDAPPQDQNQSPRSTADKVNA
jgi:hypothetical protein